MLIDIDHQHIVAEAIYCYRRSISTSHDAHRYEHCLLALLYEMTDDEKRQYEEAVSGSSYLVS